MRNDCLQTVAVPRALLVVATVAKWWDPLPRSDCAAFD